MKISIEGEADEIAAFVLAIQEQRRPDPASPEEIAEAIREILARPASARKIV